MKKYNITKKFLIREYIKNKKSQAKTAKLLNCSQALIHLYMKRYNIKVRTQSEAISGDLNPFKGLSGKNNFNYRHGECLKKHYCKESNCNNEVTYNNWRYGKGRCHKCASSGKRSARYGKPCTHGKKIYYNNILFKSTWEFLFAQWLTLSNIKWIYELKRFYFKDCSYLPDFYLPEFDCYIEVKGFWRLNTKKRFNLFKKQYPKINIKLLMKKELQELGINVKGGN